MTGQRRKGPAPPAAKRIHCQTLSRIPLAKEETPPAQGSPFQSRHGGGGCDEEKSIGDDGSGESDGDARLLVSVNWEVVVLRIVETRRKGCFAAAAAAAAAAICS